MAPEATVPRTRSTIRVLLADDVDELRMLMRLGLEDIGEVVVVGEAGDGAAAVARVAELRPDVILLDLAMPVMDGLEAIPLIRERSPATRIIIVSGFAEGPASRRALELGAHRYVNKTAEITEVAEAIRAVVEEAE